MERVRFVRSLLRRGIALDVVAAAARAGQFDRWLQPYFDERFKAGRIPTYPLAEAAAALGLDPELARRLWEVVATSVSPFLVVRHAHRYLSAARVIVPVVGREADVVDPPVPRPSPLAPPPR